MVKLLAAGDDLCPTCGNHRTHSASYWVDFYTKLAEARLRKAEIAEALADAVLRDPALFGDSMRWNEIVALAHRVGVIGKPDGNFSERRSGCARLP